MLYIIKSDYPGMPVPKNRMDDYKTLRHAEKAAESMCKKVCGKWWRVEDLHEHTISQSIPGGV